MLYIGFTNHYYTLWSVTETTRWSSDNNCEYITTHYQYLQNLSLELEKARQKIAVIAGDNEFGEDFDLRGDHGTHYTKTRIANLSIYQFTFGRLTGMDMRICDDVWQLKRAIREEPSPKRKAVARRRLIDMGELVPYKHVSREFSQKLCDEYWANNVYEESNTATHDMFCVDVYKSYATPKQVQFLEKKKLETSMSGHFYANGMRIDLKIKEVSRFSFDTMYGLTTVVAYVTEDGKMVKYMGSNPPDISEVEFVSVLATIKHDNYRGQDETKLQRIKIQSPAKTTKS